MGVWFDFQCVMIVQNEIDGLSNTHNKTDCLSTIHEDKYLLATGIKMLSSHICICKRAITSFLFRWTDVMNVLWENSHSIV